MRESGIAAIFRVLNHIHTPYTSQHTAHCGWVSGRPLFDAYFTDTTKSQSRSRAQREVGDTRATSIRHEFSFSFCRTRVLEFSHALTREKPNNYGSQIL